MRKNSHKLSAAFLRKQYVDRGLSTWAIEKEFGFSRSSVYTALKNYGIPTRTIAQSHTKYQRTDFSGDLNEKAYMLGFVIGDMRTRHHNKKRSETISIASGSTKLAQIKLIENMFKPYGRVWISQPNKRGVINVEAFVNHSFSFLLPDTRDYMWCNSNKDHFFAFLAGFTDAEGSFYVSGGKSFISWGNYNLELLTFIKSSLKVFGITTPNIHSDNLKGYIGSHGYARNNNYHHLAICKKNELSLLIKNLKKYLRHEDKLKKLAEVEKNLKLRSKK